MIRIQSKKNESDNPDGDGEDDEDDEGKGKGKDYVLLTEEGEGQIASSSPDVSSVLPVEVFTPPDVFISRRTPHFDYISSVNVKSILSLRRISFYYTHVTDLAVLSKCAPELTKFFGDPDKDKEDRVAALGPLNDLVWNMLDLC
ncbi:hypothetical protein MVEG_09220 [Podila verticillata NRRL 6337]|nr:hypothetical protein MVEG_09220 [Podila verticillata NRRL 6337]